MRSSGSPRSCGGWAERWSRTSPRRRCWPRRGWGRISTRRPGSAGSIAARTRRRSISWPATARGRERRCARSGCRVSGRSSGDRRRARSSPWPSMKRAAACTAHPDRVRAERIGVRRVQAAPLPAGEADPVVDVALDGKPLVPGADPGAGVRVQKAVYGVPGDPGRTRDVRAKLQAILDAGEFEIGVPRMAAGDDPAYGVVKTLRGRSIRPAGMSLQGERPRIPETSAFPVTGGTEDGGTGVRRDRSGRFEVESGEGRRIRAEDGGRTVSDGQGAGSPRASRDRRSLGASRSRRTGARRHG